MTMKNFVSSLVLEFQDRNIDVVGFSRFSDIPQNLILDSTHAIVDLRLKGENGLNILVELRELNPILTAKYPHLIPRACWCPKRLQWLNQPSVSKNILKLISRFDHIVFCLNLLKMLRLILYS